WKQGDRILTVSVEYPSNVYSWWNIKDKGVEIVTVEERNGRVDMDEFIDSIDETITLVAISHVEFASGFMFDLDRVAKVCRERNVFLFVDIAQSAGVMSVDLSNVDAAAWPTWKWLMGPLGMGGFYLAAQHLETIKPVFVGTDGMEPQADYLTYDFKLLDSAQRFEFSTGNCIGAIGVFDALERVQDILGPRPENSPLMSAVLSNCDRIIERFTEFDVSLYSSQNAGERSGILSFETAGDPAEVAAGLTEANIEVAARGGRLRISPHYYTTDEDIDRLCSAMQKVMSNLGQK
ncbi:MAG: aminotransferase class V-fold PLP-dependent enzyme, partial [Candidatus Lindowbacteria bacterium]|nr:aminotransferase class V-fold PLP-dependent enzyme [Candidatus Lindowbacteria bacterium]